MTSCVDVTKMGRINIVLDDDLEDRLRLYPMMVEGRAIRKGDISRIISEALEHYFSHDKEG